MKQAVHVGHKGRAPLESYIQVYAAVRIVFAVNSNEPGGMSMFGSREAIVDRTIFGRSTVEEGERESHLTWLSLLLCPRLSHG